MKETENKESAFATLSKLLERASALQSALTLFEWDNETLAPREASSLTARTQGALSAAYQEIMTGEEIGNCLKACGEENLSEKEQAIVREAKKERDELCVIPPQEYRAYQELIASSALVWAEAKKKQDFDAFAPTLKKVIDCQKRFASYRAKEGQKLYDVMLDDYEKGFDMEKLDEFFSLLKQELVPFLHNIQKSGIEIEDAFLTGDYPEDKQREAAILLAGYVGFDFSKGVLAVSEHPFTTNLHNRDVRITTNFKERVDSSLFSVIHESGHAIYELGIADDLTQTLVGQGASMGMHESQSRFFENILGRRESFWIPVYGKLQEIFPQNLGQIALPQFVRAVNKVSAGLIRTEADELTYGLHVLVRYELEKELIEQDLPVEKLPALWAENYEEYLGIRPQNVAEGVLQDIHWAQGSFGYFPSYALGSAFGAQILFAMEKEMDIDRLLAEGRICEIREYLREHIHRYGKLKSARVLLKEITGEDFNPGYYVSYLK